MPYVLTQLTTQNGSGMRDLVWHMRLQDRAAITDSLLADLGNKSETGVPLDTLLQLAECTDKILLRSPTG